MIKTVASAKVAWRHKKRAKPVSLWLLAMLVATSIGVLVLGANPAHASTTFTVDRTDDPDPTTADACSEDAEGDCSMRGAIIAANAATGADAITLPAGTYTLSRAGASEDAASTGDLDVADELTITGAGARTTRVAGGPAPFDDRIFYIQPDATATITGLTITGGKPAGEGGGVRNEGDLTLDGVAVKNNTANGHGGISSLNGTLSISDSTLSGNSADFVGGILQLRGTANITNSTISGNRAAQINGGVAASSGAIMNILNSTIASNTSPRLGGGILTAGAGTLVLVKNTIVAANTTDNCDTAQISGGIISSQGNNISSDNTCNFTQPTDKQGANPLLGLLANYGGPTDTRALLAGSPAIDAGRNAPCPSTDQRGVTRKDGDKDGTVICDIGSFERNDLTPPKVTITTPDAGQIAVERNANLIATFSEKMERKTLSTSTFKLFKIKADGTTTQITDVTVSSITNGLEATLNPDIRLVANTKYRALLTTGAKDRAGNRLDQNPTTSGSQQKVWTFTTGS